MCNKLLIYTELYIFTLFEYHINKKSHVFFVENMVIKLSVIKL